MIQKISAWLDAHFWVVVAASIILSLTEVGSMAMGLCWIWSVLK